MGPVRKTFWDVHAEAVRLLMPETGIEAQASCQSSITPEINQHVERFDSLDTDMSQYSSSISKSIQAHVYEAGVRYHAFRDGRYAFPNDEIEQLRDAMKHEICLEITDGKYFHAPIKHRLSRGRVLDLGTGTGLWAIGMGDEYPTSEVIGLDLSPIQPSYVPANTTFFVDDIESEWVDKCDKFDLIHIRHVIHSIRDIDKLLQQAYKHLKPGGYIEIQEFEYRAYCDDNSMTEETPYAWRDFLKHLEEGMRRMGSDLHAVLGVPDRLSEAGFEEINTVSYKCPIGVWPADTKLRQCGLSLRTAIMDGLRGIAQRPFSSLSWSPEKTELLLVDVRKSVMDSSFHTYYFFRNTYARKPEY